MSGERYVYTLQRTFTPREVVHIALEIRNSYAAFLRGKRGYDQNHLNLFSHPDLPLMEDITGLQCFVPETIHEATVGEGRRIQIIAPIEHDLFAARLFRQVTENLASRLPFSEY
jgi:hypothetical protein